MTATLQRSASERIDAATREQPAHDALACPSCRAAMCASEIQAGEDRVILDVCKPCRLVWFDGGEHDIVRDPFPRAPTRPPLSMRATTRTLTDMKLDHVRGARVVTSPPIATWCLIALVLFLSGMALIFAPDWITHGALEQDSEYPLRRGHLYWLLMRNFLHPNTASLLFHVSTLAIVGPIVEERFGREGFALLFVTAAFATWMASAIAHGASDPYMLGVGPFLAAAWTALLVLHPRARLQLLPRVHAGAPIWMCGLAWGSIESVAIFTGVTPPIWPALLAGVLVGAMCGALVASIDGVTPQRPHF